MYVEWCPMIFGLEIRLISEYLFFVCVVITKVFA